MRSKPGIVNYQAKFLTELLTNEKYSMLSTFLNSILLASLEDQRVYAFGRIIFVN